MELNADSLKLMIQSGVLRDGYMGIQHKTSSSSHHAAYQGPELVQNFLQVPANLASALDSVKNASPAKEHNTGIPSPEQQQSSRLSLKTIMTRFGLGLRSSQEAAGTIPSKKDVVEIVKERLKAMDSTSEAGQPQNTTQPDEQPQMELALPQPPSAHKEEAPDPLFDPNWMPKSAQSHYHIQQEDTCAPQCAQVEAPDQVQTELILGQESGNQENPLEQLTQRLEALESALQTDNPDSRSQHEEFAHLQSLMRHLEQLHTDHLQWHDSAGHESRLDKVESLESALRAEQSRWQTQQSELSHMQNLVNRIAQVQTEMTLRQATTAQEDPGPKFEMLDVLLKTEQARNDAQQSELAQLQSAIKRFELLLTEHSAQLDSVSQLNPYPRIETLQAQLTEEKTHSQAQWEELALLHSQVEQLTQRQAELTLQQTAFAENTSVHSVAERVATLESFVNSEQARAPMHREEFAQLQAQMKQLAQEQAELKQQQAALAQNSMGNGIEERVRTLESALQNEQALTQTQQNELTQLQSLLTRVEQIQTELTEQQATAIKETALINVEERICGLESQLKTEQSRWQTQQEELAQFKTLATRIETLQSELNVERESGKLLVHWLQEAERKLAAPAAPIQTHTAPAISPPRKSYFLVSPRENGRGVDRLSPNGL